MVFINVPVEKFEFSVFLFISMNAKQGKGKNWLNYIIASMYHRCFPKEKNRQKPGYSDFKCYLYMSFSGTWCVIIIWKKIFNSFLKMKIRNSLKQGIMLLKHFPHESIAKTTKRNREGGREKRIRKEEEWRKMWFSSWKCICGNAWNLFHLH